MPQPTQSQNPQQETRDFWQSTIEEFTTRKLTVPKDRLFATAGIAARLRELRTYSGSYAAGLWENKLLFDLLWRVVRHHHHHINNNNTTTTLVNNSFIDHDVPTWSWAHRGLPLTMQIHGITVSALTSTPRFLFKSDRDARHSRKTNNITSAAVKVSGFVQETTYSAITSDSGLTWHTDGSVSSPGLPGRKSDWFLDSTSLPAGPYYCLRMVHGDTGCGRRARPGEDSHSAVVYYLVLREVYRSEAQHEYKTKGASVYKRLGVLLLYGVSNYELKSPYPDVFCRNGRPLLTHGQYKDLVIM